ncbi:hypothetical protein F4802DRAFT_617016 [Xylaria palmicola]|nr:hypothetical protein F4802DRAFT_617016 [Xylaria palmicola]
MAPLTKRVCLALLSAIVWSTAVVGLPTTAAETWDELATVPSGTIREHTTVTLSLSEIVVVGGVVGPNTTDQIQIYNIPNNTWSKGPPMPKALNHPNAAVVDGKLYVLGGFADAQDVPWRAISFAAVWDPKHGNTWIPLPTLPAAEAKGASAVGTYNGTIYIAGGKAGSAQKSMTGVAAFNTATLQWVTLPEAARAIPGPRDHVGGAVIGHKMYVVGGRDTDIGNVYGTTFELDLENLDKGWVTKATMNAPRGGLATAALDGKIYTFGGEGDKSNSKGVFVQVEVYDTGADTWTVLQPMKNPRHGTAAVAVAGRIYLPGGGTSSSYAGLGGGDTGYFDRFSP